MSPQLPRDACRQTMPEVECIDPTQDPRWLRLLEHPRAGLFHSPPWLRAVAQTYGFALRAYVTGVPWSGILFCEIADLCGPRVVSLPFTDACEPLVAGDETGAPGGCSDWHRLFSRLQALAVPLHFRCFQDSFLARMAAADESLAVVKRARWHRLSLEPCLDRLWSNMDGCARRAIRLAQRAGVEVRPLASAAELDDFVRLHVALRKRKYRLLAQPAAFFAAIARHFTEADGYYPLGAFLHGRLIAGTIYLRWGDTLYYKFNTSALDALAVRPNNLLVWSGMALGRALQCRTLDLGPSDDAQPGLIRFKRSFGAEVSELQHLRWAPPGFSAERGQAARQHLGALTALLTEPGVPDDVTTRAGTLLYRFFA